MNHLSTDLFQKLSKTNLNFKNLGFSSHLCRAICLIALLNMNNTYASSTSSGSTYTAPRRSNTTSPSFRSTTSPSSSSFSRPSYSNPSSNTFSNTRTNNSNSRATSPTRNTFSFPSNVAPPTSSSKTPSSGSYTATAETARKAGPRNPRLKKINNYRLKASTKVKRVTENFHVNRQIKIMGQNSQFTYGNKALEPNQEGLEFGKVLETKNSGASLYISEYKSNLHIRPNSKVVLFKKDHQVELVQGSLYIDKNQGRTLHVKSKNSKIDIITGQSLTLFKPLLSETEVIVFAGKSQINNLGEQSDKSLVESGQWVGIGGRYTSSIGDPVNLPPTFLKKYKKALLK